MLFKKRIPFQEYCTSSLRAIFENTDEATGETFRNQCDDPQLSAADAQLFLTHLRAVFIEMMLIAIAKTSNCDISLQATIFVSTRLKELNFPELGPICHEYSQAFASSNVDGVMQVARYFDKAVTTGRMREETIGRLYTELSAVLHSHFNDFKRVKLI
jgi:hypothetical protein